jgi:hypothetical protein
MSVTHHGSVPNLALTEQAIQSARGEGIQSIVTIRYLTINPNPMTLVPAVGTAPTPGSGPSAVKYADYGRSGFTFQRERGNRYVLDITFEKTFAAVAPGTYPLPPDREGWVGGYDQSHLSIHKTVLTDPDTVAYWLGLPTKDGSLTSSRDWFGPPTIQPSKTFQHFLSGTAIWTRVSYSFDRPIFQKDSSWNVLKIQRPIPFQGSSFNATDAGRWLKLVPSYDHAQDKGWFEIVEPFMFAYPPNLAWDTDIYENGPNP